MCRDDRASLVGVVRSLGQVVGIVAALKDGAVKIEGSGLEVRQMRRDRLCVTGKIRAVTYLEGGV